MPSWARKYKGKNQSLKFLGNDRYGLYEVTSKYDASKGYSVSKQIYLGLITKEGGLVLKKKRVNDETDYLEYGLSHFIYVNFRRLLQRTIDSKLGVVYVNYLIKLIIVNYVFGSVDDEFIDMTYLCVDDSEEIKEYRDKITNVRINRGTKKIEELFKVKVDSEKDLLLLKNYLRLITVRKDTEVNIFIKDELKGLMDRYECKF